ncbi:MAG: hypothetical protein AAF493_15160 [Pseudomonadota bacterium]
MRTALGVLALALVAGLAYYHWPSVHAAYQDAVAMITDQDEAVPAGETPLPQRAFVRHPRPAPQAPTTTGVTITPASESSRIDTDPNDQAGPTSAVVETQAPPVSGPDHETKEGDVTVRALARGQSTSPAPSVQISVRNEVAREDANVVAFVPIAPLNPIAHPAPELRAARDYVAELAPSKLPQINVRSAEHFVTADQIVTLQHNLDADEIAPDALFDGSLSLDTPIKIVKEIPQLKHTTAEGLLRESGQSFETPIRLLVGDEVREVTLAEILRKHAGPSEPIAIIKMAEYVERTTLRELKETKAYAKEGVVRLLKGSTPSEATTIARLLRGVGTVNPNAIFYVHSVQSSDQQGVWGIIHDALINNFARGMALRNGRALDTYRVGIPRDADERLADNSSSYLGRLIDEKTRESTVYNFQNGRMTRDPDLIKPGREIVIVSFSREELVQIYQHFLDVSG